MVPRTANSVTHFHLLFSFYILLFQFLASFYFADSAVVENERQIIHRTIRSPQIFSGKNIFGELPQFKPPSISDFNDFKEKFTGMANLTALLQHAIEAEKTARSALQSFVDQGKGYRVGDSRPTTYVTTNVFTQVNPDPESYWTESKNCGGIIVSQTGRISYQAADYYKDYERCIWTVRANYRSKIKVMFKSGDLEEGHDYVVVTELLSTGSVDWGSKRISPGQTNIFDGPVVFISFVSDGSVRKSGFQIDFEGLGSNINTKTIYKHFHLTDWMGQFDYANLSASLLETNHTIEKGTPFQATITISPSYLNASRLHVSIPDNSLNLRPETCDKTQLAVYHDFASLESFGRSHRCCGTTCEIHDFATSNRMMASVFTSTDATEPNQLQIRWTTDINDLQVQSIDTCGGLLKGDAGTISYKTNAQYDNNERCLWAIHQDNMALAEIKVQLVKDGFEYQYDYITLSYPEGAMDNPNLQTKFLYKSGAPVKIPSGILFVQFYSDIATFGKTTGFELIWEITYTTATDNTSSSSSESAYQQVHILNPHFLDDSPLILDTSELPSSANDLVTFFKSKRGRFSQIEISDSESQESEDGTIIVVSQCTSQSSNPSDTAEENIIKWSKGEKASSNGTEDECGHILVGDWGKITYKLGKEYDVNERCTWIIKSRHKSLVTVQLMADGFESCCDGIVINAVNTKSGTIDPNGVAINRENRFHTFDEQVLLVLFYSDHSVVGTGFTLEFQTKGDEIVDDQDIKHGYVSLTNMQPSGEPFGPVLLHPSANTLSIDAFPLHLQHEGSANSEVTLKLGSLKTDECNEDSIALYHMPNNITEFQQLKRYPNQKLCDVGGISTGLLNELMPDEETFTGVKGMLVVIMKVVEDDPNKSASLTFA